MFEKEAEEIMMQKVIKENDCIMTPCKTLEDCQLYDFCFDDMVDAFKDGAEFGYNKANEWHYVRDGDLPRQDGHTCFSIEVLANNKKWVHYRFDSGKWFCGNKEVKVIAWKEIVLPELKESE